MTGVLKRGEDPQGYNPPHRGNMKIRGRNWSDARTSRKTKDGKQTPEGTKRKGKSLLSCVNRFPL